MSKVKIEGNASGTGTLTIAAPNTNTDSTLTLPDSAGELLTTTGDGSQLTGISSYADSDALTLFNATGSAPVYACRAWVNFNGTGTVAIRESGNVSSITDNGTGQYKVNFSTAMPDANYTIHVTAMDDSYGNGNGVHSSIHATGGLESNGVSINQYSWTGSYVDLSTFCVTVFR